ncbi:MAG: hypothetical protein ACREQ5_03245 [Candidatus Dormibacteria bacterium]
MAINFAFAGLNNTWVPSPADSNNLVVDFSRNPADFGLNLYSQLVPAERPRGKWTKMTVETAGRLLQSDLRDHQWADNADAPRGNLNNESFEFPEFNCFRYLYVDKVGQMALQNAQWDYQDWMARRMAQQAMTGRTQLIVTAATTTANYPSANTADVTTINGGYQFPDATTANLAMKKAINYGQNIILQSTLGAVNPEDFRFVINPNLARKISETQEFVDMVKHSPEAYAELTGELPNRNRYFGIPKRLYGIEVVIDETVKVTSKKGATTPTYAYVVPDATPFLVSRPGGLVGVEGAPSFSTLTHFVWEENDMMVETFNDIENKRVSVRVVDTVAAIVTAGLSGFLFTNVM